MQPPPLALLAMLGICVGSAGAADATSPVDYTQRNESYAPGARVAPQKRLPGPETIYQDRRVEKATVEKPSSGLREREAALAVAETHPKQVREKTSERPEVIDHVTSDLNHRPAAITTASNAPKPPMVAKYQDSLTAASATNMARFPAIERATTAKINRFVFRRNPAEPNAAVTGAISAGGRSDVAK